VVDVTEYNGGQRQDVSALMLTCAGGDFWSNFSLGSSGADMLVSCLAFASGDRPWLCLLHFPNGLHLNRPLEWQHAETSKGKLEWST
jgi:hypothetical protein